MITLLNIHNLWRLARTLRGLLTLFLKGPRRQEKEISLKKTQPSKQHSQKNTRAIQSSKLIFISRVICKQGGDLLLQLESHPIKAKWRCRIPFYTQAPRVSYSNLSQPCSNIQTSYSNLCLFSRYFCNALDLCNFYIFVFFDEASSSSSLFEEYISTILSVGLVNLFLLNIDLGAAL